MRVAAFFIAFESLKRKIHFQLILSVSHLLISSELLAQQNTFSETFWVQQETLTLMLGKEAVDFGIDKYADYIELSDRELVNLKNKKIPFHNLKADTTELADQSKNIRLRFDIESITMGCLKLENVPAQLNFNSLGLDPNETPKIGLKFLNNYGSWSLSNDTLVLRNISTVFRDSDCPPRENDVSAPKSSPAIKHNLMKLDQIKLIACSTDPAILQKKDALRSLLENRFSLVNVEEETKIPPPIEAVNRVGYGATIRFFELKDESLALELQSKLQQAFPNDSFVLENMLPYFKKPLPGLLEIWIK